MRVLIVGAGLLGLTTAFFLRRHQLEITVIDRASGPGLETSFANGGMLHASQANPWNAPGVFWQALKMLGREDAALLVRPAAIPRLLSWGVAFIRHSAPSHYLRNFEKNARLARYSLAQMKILREGLGGEYDYRQRGTIKLFRTESEVVAAAALGDLLRQWNIAYEVISPARTVELEPALGPIAAQLAGGLYFPDDEAGDAYRFCQLLAADLERRGVTFRYGTRIKRVLLRGGRAVGVVTDGDEPIAGQVVLAAGSYTPLLAKGLGLRVPVAPVKGYSITLPSNGWQAGPVIPVIDDHLHAAVCPLGNRLRVAGTAEFAGYSLALTPSRINNLYGLVKQLYPAFEPYLERDHGAAWTGLRPMSVDGVGIMGATAVPDLYLNTGHGPLGWTMAAGAGRLVADEIAGVRTELDLAPYRVTRF